MTIRFEAKSIVELRCPLGHGSTVVVVDAGVEWDPETPHICTASTSVGSCLSALEIASIVALEPEAGL